MKDITNSVRGNIATYDMENKKYGGKLVSNDSGKFETENDKASVSAHYYASIVLDFYKNLFNRNSLDNKGMEIISYTHYGTNINNAYWTGYEMIYGDGDGSQYTYLSGDLDIVGHEMTHGVIEHTANLEYRNESGSLNESISDVFGVLISTYEKYNVANGGKWIFNPQDWVIGDDVYTPNIPGDALRSLAQPSLYGQPEHMKDYKYLSDTPAGDYGGVHINSGIVNKAAFLIASNVGMEKTARIYYRALNYYMNPYTDFKEARYALIQAATDLYGAASEEVNNVALAFDSVGIVDSSSNLIIPVTGISLNKTSAALKVNESIKINAVITPTNATNTKVLWKSSNSSVAAVDGSGNIKAVGVGKAIITATTEDGGYSAEAIITVKNNSVPIISGIENKTIKIGERFDSKAGVRAYDNEDGDITSKIIVSGIVDESKKGNYTLNYTVTDSDGNKVSKNVIITVEARNVQVNSLIGSDRYETAVMLSKSEFNSAETAVIVNGGALADGLAATPLASYKRAPLLLTAKDSLPNTTKNEIKRLGVKNIIIVGGTSVVSSNIAAHLKNLGITNIVRIAGNDRYDTSLEIAKYIDKNFYDVSKIVISNGLGEADALSIASVAGRDKMPIILVRQNEVPAKTYNWLREEKLENAYIIGGSVVVSDKVLNIINEITASDLTQNRLGGKDRYATNALVIEKFYGNIIDKVYIAKGLQLIDALAAGPVAAINAAPVVLSGNDLTKEQQNVLNKRYGDIIIRTGGGISDKAVTSLKSALQ